jgi:hypothetical protein
MRIGGNKKGEREKEERNFEDEFYLEMDWLTGCCPASYFYFLFFFFGMESEVMTVRDAQERTVGSSVRECRCTYGRVPGSECKWKMVKNEEKKASCLALHVATWQRW